MKGRIAILSMLIALPLQLLAQMDDDMYFVPKKVDRAVKSAQREREDRAAYYSGSSRSTDEYNRRGNYKRGYAVNHNDTISGDMIYLDGRGAYGDDSTSVVIKKGKRRSYSDYYDDDDYFYSRRVSRFYDPYFFGYYGYYPYVGYAYYPYGAYAYRYDPYWDFYYGGYYSSPWIWGGWYGYSYYDYPYYSYHRYYPYYGWGGYSGYYTRGNRHVSVASRTGVTRNFSGSSFGGSRATAPSTRSYSNNNYSSPSNTQRTTQRFGGYRNDVNTQTRSYSQGYQPSNNSGSSYGGSNYSGGGSFGGSRAVGGSGGSSSGGGARFGGRR